jgi:hypothetical protein
MQLVQIKVCGRLWFNHEIYRTAFLKNTEISCDDEAGFVQIYAHQCIISSEKHNIEIYIFRYLTLLREYEEHEMINAWLYCQYLISFEQDSVTSDTFCFTLIYKCDRLQTGFQNVDVDSNKDLTQLTWLAEQKPDKRHSGWCGERENRQNFVFL